jgi:hypothetical protein
MNRVLRAAPLALALAFVASGCATAQKKDLSKFVSYSPRSILVVPVVNKSVDVDAADYFLSTLTVPLAERGYYVFPVNLVKRMLEDDGLSDAALVHGADAARLCGLFGADAVLLVTIERWDSKYLVITTNVTVEFDYVLKDGKLGETLWQDHQTMVYSPQSTNTGNPLASLIAAVVDAAVTKAAPNYMPLARQANEKALAYPGPGIPAGPYRPEYKKDVAGAL